MHSCASPNKTLSTTQVVHMYIVYTQTIWRPQGYWEGPQGYWEGTTGVLGGDHRGTGRGPQGYWEGTTGVLGGDHRGTGRGQLRIYPNF